MMKKRWKYTDAPDIYYQDLLGAALVDELDQLNKTLQVIASNQERQRKEFVPKDANSSNQPSPN